jgi:SHS2 domain-containing protein
MFEVMTDVGKVRTKFKDTVEVTGADEYALLYNWLEALLVKFDTNETLLSQFKILSLHHSGEGFRFKAEIWGEKFDPRRHVQKVGVKAITYHQMEIIKKQDKVTVKFILDI